MSKKQWVWTLILGLLAVRFVYDLLTDTEDALVASAITVAIFTPVVVVRHLRRRK